MYHKQTKQAITKIINICVTHSKYVINEASYNYSKSYQYFSFKTNHISIGSVYVHPMKQMFGSVVSCWPYFKQFNINCISSIVIMPPKLISKM